jgi:hypothetical protein
MQNCGITLIRTIERLYFLASFLKAHFSKQITGLNPERRVIQHGGCVSCGTSSKTKLSLRTSLQDSISWQHQASCVYCICISHNRRIYTCEIWYSWGKCGLSGLMWLMPYQKYLSQRYLFYVKMLNKSMFTLTMI